MEEGGEGVRRRDMIKRANMSTEGLIGVVDIRRIGIPSLEEGLFPDDVLELIEQRRERIMDNMRALVSREEKGELAIPEKRSRSVDEVKSTLQIIILEIEKLQVQTGTRCVEECNKMVSELENIKRKIVKAEQSKAVPYKWIGMILACLLIIAYKKTGT
ncbi:hypothetical protein NECID01_1568 [Nematocida sp. AWRm77]|nr:hypothetical protein NECID01_1568 [Nematocida sp. AWRm77]